MNLPLSSIPPASTPLPAPSGSTQPHQLSELLQALKSCAASLSGIVPMSEAQSSAGNGVWSRQSRQNHPQKRCRDENSIRNTPSEHKRQATGSNNWLSYYVECLPQHQDYISDIVPALGSANVASGIQTVAPTGGRPVLNPNGTTSPYLEVIPHFHRLHLPHSTDSGSKMDANVQRFDLSSSRANCAPCRSCLSSAPRHSSPHAPQAQFPQLGSRYTAHHQYEQSIRHWCIYVPQIEPPGGGPRQHVSPSGLTRSRGDSILGSRLQSEASNHQFGNWAQPSPTSSSASSIRSAATVLPQSHTPTGSVLRDRASESGDDASPDSGRRLKSWSPSRPETPPPPMLIPTTATLPAAAFFDDQLTSAQSTTSTK